MFQLGLDLETDDQVTHWYVDIIRSFVALFDKIVYWLLMIMYEVFFNIADSTIFSSDTIKDFYGRVQLIIGVFMIFKVSVSLMQAVMDPDKLTNKDTGMGKIVTRIVMMLAMFTAIIPLNIPYAEEGTFNAYLNENGLLFGVLYSLQARVIDNNVLGKLIVGNVSTNQTDSNTTDKSTGIDKEKSARELATFVLKTFVRINLKEGATEAGASDPSNYMCSRGWGDDYKTYADSNSTPNDILNNINDWCHAPGDSAVGDGNDDDHYSFVYTPIISTICGAVIVVVLFGFCVDIAVRALKLAVLRLLAPIPIISYIDPKSAKDGSFAAWVKSLTSTYLDLFLRLAIIFFVLFLVQSIIDKGLVIPIGNGAVGLISTVFIIIGMFIFAKMAPKFIKDALGLKGTMTNFGLSGIMAGVGAIREGGGLHDAFRASRDATDTQLSAYNQGKQGPGIGENFNIGADMMARELTGNDKMTAKQMHRGKSKLNDMNITNIGTEEEKNRMYEMQDDAEKAKNLYDRVSRGDATEAELRVYASENNLTYDSAKGTMTDRNGRVQGVRQSVEDNYLNAQADAGKQKKKYEDMQKELDRYGGSRNGYRAKYGNGTERDARLSDLLTHEGRDAMRTGNFRETVRNVASIPGNEIDSRRTARDQNRYEGATKEQEIAGVSNQRMNDSRNTRNNGNGNGGNS